jgi:hypothetical protein
MREALHFLLIEDADQDRLEVWCQQQRIKTHRCHAAVDVRSLPADILASATGVLLGLSQPRETLAALAMIRGTRQLRSLPAVVVLPFGAANIASSLQRLGVFLYLTRPFTDQVLEAGLEAAGAYWSVACKRPGPETESTTPLGHLIAEGTFSLKTPEEAGNLAGLLAAACPDPGRQMCGIHEILMNAIEHGNLGISRDQKAQLLRSGELQNELNRRLALPEYRDRSVTVSFHREPKEVILTVRDQGSGFDWRTALAGTIDHASGPSGRGIMLARLLSFDKLEYRDPGNEAIARIRCGTLSEPSPEWSAPVVTEPVALETAPVHCGLDCGATQELHACRALLARAQSSAGNVLAEDHGATLTQTLEALVAKNTELLRLHDEIRREQLLAGHVLGNVRRQGCLDAPGIRYALASLEFFNGDIALAARTPTGELRWLLGDFTGHGLSAAIGSIPVASAFYATSKKNIPFAEVVATINDLLKSLLPPGLFCAASFLALSADSTTLSVWNGGLPAVLVRRAGDGGIHQFPSRALPLGLVGSAELGVSLEHCAVAPGDEVFAYSDGLSEATDTQGRLFGCDRVEQVLRGVDKPGLAFDQLLGAVTSFRGSVRASDDVSLVAVTVGETVVSQEPPRPRRSQARDLKPEPRPSQRPPS